MVITTLPQSANPKQCSASSGSAPPAPGPASTVTEDIGEHYEYVFELSPDFICSICHDPLIEPISLANCGHTFCRVCITNWIQRGNNSCPNRCNGVVDESSFATPMPFFIDNLNSLKVYCPVNKCKIERRHFQAHVLNCPRYCPRECGQKIAKVDDEAHITTCGGIEVRCPQCTWIGRREYLARHTKSCNSLLEYEEQRKTELEKEITDRLTDLEAREAIIKEKEERLKEGLASVPDRITLNVAGERFYTTKKTLLSWPDSLFSLLGQENFDPDVNYENEEYFLDRDPEAFRVILKYLRSGGQLQSLEECARLHRVTREEIVIEAKYYMIEDILKDLGVAHQSTAKEQQQPAQIELRQRALVSQQQLYDILSRHPKGITGQYQNLMLNNCALTGLYIPSGDYSYSQFQNSDLSKSVFTGATNFNNVNLADSNLSYIDLSHVVLTEANLAGSNLSGSDLSGSDLSGANLSGSDLSGANLSGSDLSDVNLSGANLSDANLSGADLFGANLSDANLSGTKLPSDLSNVDLFDVDLSDRNNDDSFFLENILREP